MPLDALKQRVDQQYSRWIKMAEHALADGQISCEEAREWLDWYAERKKELALLKKEIRLEIRDIRGKFKVKLADAAIWGKKTVLRNEQTKMLHPYEHLQNEVERLLLEGEKMKPILEKKLSQDCADS